MVLCLRTKSFTNTQGAVGNQRAHYRYLQHSGVRHRATAGGHSYQQVAWGRGGMSPGQLAVLSQWGG
eukprot:8651329-Karenia_brevis.AAC.1